MNDIQSTHNLVCDFGKYSGILYTRIPVSYLLWMVNNNHSKSDIADAELKRRGTIFPKLEVSGHAIDRASLNCRKIWHKTSAEGEGLNSWLTRISQEALSNGIKSISGRYVWKDLLEIAIENDGIWPIVKTVIKLKEIENE